MVTNQDGLGTSHPKKKHSTLFMEHVMKSFANEGVHFQWFILFKTFHENAPHHVNPATGMLTKYINNPDYDLYKFICNGDRITDVQLAKKSKQKQ